MTRVGSHGLLWFTGFWLRNVTQPWGVEWVARDPDSLLASFRCLQSLSAWWAATATPSWGFYSQFTIPSERVPRARGRAGGRRCDQLLDRQTRLWIPSSSAMYVVAAAWDWGHSRPFLLSLKSRYFCLGNSPTEMPAQRYTWEYLWPHCNNNNSRKGGQMKMVNKSES